MIDPHDCPGCGAANVPHHMLACRDCWFRLPRDIRAEIWRAYRHDGPGSQRHTDAILEAAAWYRDHRPTTSVQTDPGYV